MTKTKKKKKKKKEKERGTVNMVKTLYILPLISVHYALKKLTIIRYPFIQGGLIIP